MPSVSSMPSASPSVEPTGSPTSTFWALQKEAIRKGSYADTGPNYNLIRTYKRCRGSHRTGRSPRYDDYVTPDYSNSFSEESQSDQGGGLEAGIASPKSLKRDNSRDHQLLAADLSADTSEFDNVGSDV
eukprot:scaffold23728_cov134-Skeletonema_marinoi.AAC.1